MRRCWICLLGGLWALWVCAPVAGQEIGGTEEIDFDRPEAWAMQYFASVSQLTALGAPEWSRPGELRLAVELDSIPKLSDAERTVGFNGTKREDLNKSPLFGRLRTEIGLPRGFTVGLGVTPPIELDGATPLIGAASLGRPLWRGQRWRLGLSGHLTGGSIEGEITCSEDVVAAGDDPVQNPLGCEVTSDDEMRFLLGGLELTLGRELGWDPGGEVFAALSVQRLDAEFRVDARYQGIEDRTRLETAGSMLSAVAGIRLPVAERWGFSGQIYYAPLEVSRPPQRDRQIDGLLNARAALSFRLR